ncbi:MAG: alpha/beta fold hydrolase [Deltaproteobacteria bacterium]|nr:alpha/beta fold hydrolase [Deltaproteobacteria bacterium]
MSAISFGSRAQVTTFLQKIDDATVGNKDGIVGNEQLPAGVVGGGPAGGIFEKNPILFALKQNLAAGWSKADENEKLGVFLQATEKTFGGPVTTLARPAHVDVEAWNAFRLDKAIHLVRVGKTPADVSDHVVKASGTVDGNLIAPRDLFVQRVAPQGTPTGQTLILSPGFLETGRNHLEQAELLSKQGHAVVVLDHQWAGLSQGDRGGIDRGFGIARDVAAVAAWAHAQNPHDKLTLVGTSMGGGAGAFGAALMNDLGKIVLDGPAMPKALDCILQGPFFARTKSIPNDALAVAGVIDGLKEIPLPAMGLPILSGDQATLRKLAAHATTEQLSGRGQAFHASTTDLATMRRYVENGAQTQGRVYVIHAEHDTLADFQATKDWVALLGQQATLQPLKGSTSHVIAENPSEQNEILKGITWLSRAN